jgi:hypothetical protein
MTGPQSSTTNKSKAAPRIGGEGNPRTGQQPSWNDMYERLKQLKEKTGNANLPQRGFHDPLLQAWINEQRRQCKLAREQQGSEDEAEKTDETSSYRNGECNLSVTSSLLFTGIDEHKLTFERVLELERLGFSWDSPHDVEWKKRYGELKRYKDARGHCRVPSRDKGHPELGRWVMTQRRQYALLKQDRKSRMTRERQRLLEHIDFEWVLREGQFFIVNNILAFP